jgi:hypothetical protein
MSDAYVVVVLHNVVHAIEREPAAGGGSPRTPLEIGTELAGNNRRNGCIDGRYRCDDAATARVFATLCLDYAQALVERRRKDIDGLPPGFASFLAE